MAGTCNYADRCNFAHGEAELRPWVPPALVSGTGPKIEETIWVGVRYPPHPALPRPSFHTPFCSFFTLSYPVLLAMPRRSPPYPTTPHATAPSYPLGALCVPPTVASLNDRSKTIRTANPVRSW